MSDARGEGAAKIGAVICATAKSEIYVVFGWRQISALNTRHMHKNAKP